MSLLGILLFPRIASPNRFKPSTPVTVPRIFKMSGETLKTPLIAFPTNVPSPPFFIVFGFFVFLKVARGYYQPKIWPKKCKHYIKGFFFA